MDGVEAASGGCPSTTRGPVTPLRYPGRRVCVVLLTGLGDVVNGLPLVNALKDHDPRSRHLGGGAHGVRHAPAAPVGGRRGGLPQEAGARGVWSWRGSCAAPVRRHAQPERLHQELWPTLSGPATGWGSTGGAPSRGCGSPPTTTWSPGRAGTRWTCSWSSRSTGRRPCRGPDGGSGSRPRSGGSRRSLRRGGPAGRGGGARLRHPPQGLAAGPLGPRGRRAGGDSASTDAHGRARRARKRIAREIEELAGARPLSAMGDPIRRMEGCSSGERWCWRRTGSCASRGRWTCRSWACTGTRSLARGAVPALPGPVGGPLRRPGGGARSVRVRSQAGADGADHRGRRAGAGAAGGGGSLRGSDAPEEKRP